jgi:hypothetical protein
MVNCLNTIILKSFLIIVFTSILHLFYRTYIYLTTQNMYDTYFLSIEFSALLLVTSWILQRYPHDNTRQMQEIKLQQNKTEKR